LPVSSDEPAFEALDFGHDDELAFAKGFFENLLKTSLFALPWRSFLSGNDTQAIASSRVNPRSLARWAKCSR
jgi:hypothetical protein